MIIKIWDRADIEPIGNRGHKPTHTIEIDDAEIDHFIDRFGEKFGKAFGEAIVKGLEAGD